MSDDKPLTLNEFSNLIETNRLRKENYIQTGIDDFKNDNNIIKYINNCLSKYATNNTEFGKCHIGFLLPYSDDNYINSIMEYCKSLYPEFNIDLDDKYTINSNYYKLNPANCKISLCFSSK
jgi:hypothetical protein